MARNKNPYTRRPLFRPSAPKDPVFTDEHRKLVYNTSRWQAFLYEARATATDKTERNMIHPLRQDGTLSGAKHEDVRDFAHAMGRELFGRLYGDPSKLEDSRKDAPPWMDTVHETLDEMPEWDTLRKQVHGDPDFSALASNAMLTSLLPRLEGLINQAQEEKPPGDDEPGEGPDGGGGQDGMPSATDAIRAALRSACTEAAEKTDEGKTALGGLAPGLDATPPNDLQKDTDRFDLIQAVTHDRNFQEIARRAGRLRRISGRASYRRSRDVYEEVVDVETGGDITRLLPSEIMNLMDDDLELLELSRIVDGTALQYRLEGFEPQGRGPVVFIRDVSGSMCGDPHMWGAAVGVALASQTAREKRSMRSACFNGGVHYGRLLDSTGLYEYDMDEFAAQGWSGPKNYASVTTLSISRTVCGSKRLATAKAAMAHARDGVSGGTDFGPAMAWAMLAGLEEPRADFVFLTDGCADIDPEILARLQAAREAGLRVFGLTVNGGSMSGPVRQICDEVIDIDSCGSEGEATKSLGSMLRKAR